MSNVKIEGNALGTGTLTIAAPNTNTDRTLTLPDSTGTIVAATGGVLPALDGSNLTNVSAGKVLQVVNYGTFAETSASGATDVLTDLAVTITPSSASSKILVLANYSIGSSGSDALSRLYRDRTALGSFIKSRPSSTWANFMNTHAINYLDSPSTTSAVTYAIYIRSISAITYFNRNGASTINNAYSTITAMEIAG